MNLCEYQGSVKVGITRIGVQQIRAARAKNPRLVACRPERIEARAARPDLNRALDASNSGTFSDARRAAILGHQDPATMEASVSRLLRASEDRRIDQNFAARRIAEITDPHLAAAQAELLRPTLTPAELAERRRLRANGASDTELLAAQIRRLQEACRPIICFLTGDRRTGIANAMNTGRVDPEAAAARPDFLRFCNAQDLERAQVPATSWGDWIAGRRPALPELPGAVLPPRARNVGVGPVPAGPPSDGGVPIPPPPSADTPEYLCFYTKDLRTGLINGKNAGYVVRAAVLRRPDFAGWC